METCSEMFVRPAKIFFGSINIMKMFLSKSQEDDIMTMCLSKSRDDDIPCGKQHCRNVTHTGWARTYLCSPNEDFGTINKR
jgi:hypothetical protein